jgi:hypothetical protein
LQALAYNIARTRVPVEERRVFLGRVAAPMLALLGVGVAMAGCGESPRVVSQR